MVTKTISNRVIRSFRGSQFAIGPVLFPSLRWLSITKTCSGILLTRLNGCASEEQVFQVKKTRGTPMGCPKLELLASNGVHICHAMHFSMDPLNPRMTPGCIMQK